MSESLVEHLKRFTPDGTGVDRDTLLFEAGRASVRPDRRWPALTGLLALSQALTLLMLVARPDSTPPVDRPQPAVARVEREPVSLPSERNQSWALRRQALEQDVDLSPRVKEQDLIPDSKPLSAWLSPRSTPVD
jgi:hypothetical protein